MELITTVPETKSDAKIEEERLNAEHKAAERAGRAPDPTALLYHLAERYSEPDTPATFLIEGALDTEIAITFTYGQDSKKVSAVGKTVEEATTALRAKLTQPEEPIEPKAPAKAKAKAAPVITRSNKGA